MILLGLEFSWYLAYEPLTFLKLLIHYLSIKRSVWAQVFQMGQQIQNVVELERVIHTGTLGVLKVGLFPSGRSKESTCCLHRPRISMNCHNLVHYILAKSLNLPTQPAHF